MGGNVLEWTTDRYSIYVVGPEYQSTDPVGPKSGDNYVIRGAGWLTGKMPELRARRARSGARGPAGPRVPDRAGTRSEVHALAARARLRRSSRFAARGDRAAAGPTEHPQAGTRAATEPRETAGAGTPKPAPATSRRRRRRPARGTRRAEEDEETLPPLPPDTAPAGPPPQRFNPTEKVRADFPVSFPIDI